MPKIYNNAGIRIVQLVHRSVEPVAPERSRYSCLFSSQGPLKFTVKKSDDSSFKQYESKTVQSQSLR